MVPAVLLPPAVPSTDHVIPRLGTGVTLAANCCVPFAGTIAEVGVIVTLTERATVTWALPLFVASATLTAVTVWLAASAGAA